MQCPPQTFGFVVIFEATPDKNFVDKKFLLGAYAETVQITSEGSFPLAGGRLGWG
jgi:hypothetical protein